MKVQCQPELEERNPLKQVVDAATPVLAEAIGSPATEVTATWGFRSDDHGRPVIQLTLSHWSGCASADFAPEDLQPADRARRRFRHLWRDLLQEAIQKKNSRPFRPSGLTTGNLDHAAQASVHTRAGGHGHTPRPSSGQPR